MAGLFVALLFVQPVSNYYSTPVGPFVEPHFLSSNRCSSVEIKTAK